MVLCAIVVCGFYRRLFSLLSLVDRDISPAHPSPGMEKEIDDISVPG